LNWQVFWLTFFLKPSHPSVNEQWHAGQKVFIKAYSCGYSSGIAPDSLFRRFPNWEVGHQYATKVGKFAVKIILSIESELKHYPFQTTGFENRC